MPRLLKPRFTIPSLLAAALAALIAAPYAEAAFPGKNGGIAFRDPGNGAYETPALGILTVAPQGGSPVGLVADTGVGFAGGSLEHPAEPAYSADGMRLAFTASWRPPGAVFSSERNIYVINADGSGLNRITTGAYDSSPSFSRGGEQIVFSRRSGFSDASSIFMVNTDGSGLTTLIAGGAAVRDGHPRFSPDGKTIVFNSRHGIDLMRADGTRRRPLIRSRGEDLDADFSPDGRRITFASTRNKAHPGVYIAKRNGRSVRQIAATYNRNDGCSRVSCPQAPVFSPDGKRIVYEDTGSYGSSLYKIRANSPRCSRRGVCASDRPGGHRVIDICCADSGGDAITPTWQPLPRP